MSDALPIAPVAAPAPQKAPEAKTPEPKVVAKPAEAKPVEVDDTEEYVVDGKPTRLNKAQRQLHFQKALAADKRMKEAADIKAKTEDFWKDFEADPEGAMRKLGKDPDKIFSAHLEKKARLATMTEEQREAASLKERAEAAEKKAAKFEEEQKAARQAEVDARNFKALETQLIAASDKLGLASTPDVLEGLCDIALEFYEYGASITADQVAQEFVRREKEHFEAKDKRLFSVLKGQKLLAYLGDATLAEVKAALSQVDADSLKDIPKPQAKAKTQVRAHERTVKGHINENAFDKKFGL